MRRPTLLDNWTLQNVGELLTEGFSFDTTRAYQAEGKELHVVEVPEDLVRFRCLMQTLTDVVLSHQIVVEKEHTRAWEEYPGIQQLRDRHVLVRKPFADHSKEWLPFRRRLLESIELPSAILQQLEENRLAFKAEKKTPHSMPSLIISGGTGMLARAEAYDLLYSPHPMRGDFLGAALRGKPSAVGKLQTFFQDERAKLWRYSADSAAVLAIPLAPIGVLAVREANSPQDFIPVAVQLREEFKKLRDWLNTFDDHLAEGNPAEAAKFSRELEFVRTKLEKLQGGKTSFEAYIDFSLPARLRLGAKLLLTPGLFRWNLSVRQQVYKLATASVGSAEVRKLLRWFEITGPKALQLEKVLLG